MRLGKLSELLEDAKKLILELSLDLDGERIPPVRLMETVKCFGPTIMGPPPCPSCGSCTYDHSDRPHEQKCDMVFSRRGYWVWRGEHDT
jgi:hypothetical protein